MVRVRFSFAHATSVGISTPVLCQVARNLSQQFDGISSFRTADFVEVVLPDFLDQNAADTLCTAGQSRRTSVAIEKIEADDSVQTIFLAATPQPK